MTRICRPEMDQEYTWTGSGSRLELDNLFLNIFTDQNLLDVDPGGMGGAGEDGR